MSKTAMSTDRLEELRRVCEVHGADPARWPADQRARLLQVYASREAAEIRAEAEALDGFLNAATAPRMAEDLERRIAASYAPPAKTARSLNDFLRMLSPFSGGAPRRLIPAGALAGLGAIGLASGVMSASAQAPLTPEGEALAYVESDFLLASLDEEEAATWDAD
ncbi:hypothetical protein [Hyphococcus sp.]|uniref:hypothetical protein n=1 Tax=Hyphococcus sp. TaxID=2038636 RepID=UPI003CCB7745